ncbi:GNAT family N-acetyltransferase [Treponema sp. Marseille-Q4523]|uniref:GNAT family N-acetyltransferase n=1 Tax=Treponema sp. Marseille-Q4523 TaxID=2810610 RepID=UPI00196073E9|nr:GNAT family N-acetyltransferase [Treponema sp. Marseille-Q4523]MBM7023730.1 GNAT family N-acetyltransferase [Treponema sp. Marseille-Q4523]
MRFIPVDEKKKAETLAFLAKHERFCVSLVEHIRLGGSESFTVESDARETLGIISVKSRMLLCIPNARSLQNDGDFYTSLKAFLSDKKISCVNGEADASHLIMNILAEIGRMPLHVNEYALMTFSEAALKKIQAKDKRHAAVPEEPQMCGMRTECAAADPISENTAATDEKACCEKFKIVRCGIRDADALMPLQLAYEAEEVLPPCRTQNPAVTRKNLERILKTEYVVALQNSRGEPAAKANTNAVGIRWAQIGGVYTAPDFRRKGCASLLVETLAEKIVASKRLPVLYARNGNEGAQKAYAALGFRKTGGFTIAYY